jgi:hypothetical protein
MRKGLGEVADLLAAKRNFLREKPYMVGVGEHLLEGVPRLLKLASPRE